jgi:hypothetical protein
VFENRALRRIFGPKREEEEVGWRRQYYGNLITYALHQTLLGWSNQNV